ALRDLFPRRRLAVRLFAPDGGQLSLVYATDALAEPERDRVVLSEDALARHELRSEDVERLGIGVQPGYRPIFRDAGEGFDVPLATGDGIVGVLNVEYDPGLAEPSFD